ncbi:hypothetical protein G9P44_005740 [Scheffersomyces stipitis]|nr:hypothetical protein G9P44_005740 [Scheffersomyces stipitis]
MSSHNPDKYNNTTSSALLEQLVYIDTFMNNGTSSSAGDLTPNLDIDGQLSIDLAAFADDSFIFPDEDKPKNHNHDDDDDRISNKDFGDHNGKENEVIFKTEEDPLMTQHPLNLDSSTDNSPDMQQQQKHLLANQNGAGVLNDINFQKLPKFPVPPGAKSSLESAGLSQNQIDLLSALIAQHQTSLGNSIPQSQNSPSVQQVSQQQHAQQHSQQSQHHKQRNQSFSAQIPGQSFSGYSPRAQRRPHNLGNSSSFSSFNNDGLTPSANGGSSAELDKRRRNTAASARFRIKKKLKEKQMENKILSLNELIKEFEVKIQQLEMENKLLRNLIIEKGSQKSDNELKLLRERAKMN